MNEQKKRLKQLIKWSLLPIASLTVIIIAFLAKIPIPCKFHAITGLYCPGCGLTRMIINLLKGNIAGAFSNNPLLFIMTPFIIIYLVINGYLYIKNGTILKIPKTTCYILLIITIAFGILRNLPQFAILAP